MYTKYYITEEMIKDWEDFIEYAAEYIRKDIEDKLVNSSGNDKPIDTLGEEDNGE